MVATPSLYPSFQVQSASWFLLVYVSVYGESHKGLRGSGGVKSLKQGVLLENFSCKFCRNGYAAGLWAQGYAAFLLFRDNFRRFPKSDAIPPAHQWGRKEDKAAVELGLVTMISVYLKVLNIDLTTWFSTVILVGHAAGQATVEMELRSGTLLGRDIPHLEQNILNALPSCR